MPRKRTRRTKSDTPFVVVTRTKPREGRAPQWRGKWTDPLTGNVKFKNLTREYPDEDGRLGWAKRKSAAIVALREAIANGTYEPEPEPEPEPTRTPLASAIETYLARRSVELRPSTLVVYRQGIDAFRTWAEAEGLGVAEELRPPHLAAFREHLVRRPRQEVRKRGGRGERRGGKRRRSPSSINKDLRSVKACLNSLRDDDEVLPGLTSDDIRKRLKAAKVAKPVPEILRTPELRALLAAARRHDAAVYGETRAEHRGEGEPGETPRYDPIGPFVVAVLLTGGRFAEVLGLTWAEVLLEDEAIVLSAKRTKTGAGRRIDLSVCPGLPRLLAALRLRAGGRDVVFPDLSAGKVEAARARLVETFGAPEFTWQTLRRTCGSYVTCSSVYGQAGAFLAARRLGHGILVAERHYIGSVTNLDQSAKTIEAAMGVENLVEEVVRSVAGFEPELASGTA